MPVKKYRRVPNIVEALQWTGRNVTEVAEFTGKKMQNSNCLLLLDTPEGVLKAKTGDYIVKDIRGKFFPVDKHVFEKTYEEA